MTRAHCLYTGYTQKNGAVSKVNKKFISQLNTGTTYTASSSNCPSFSCATSSSLLVLTAGLRGQFPRWRRSRKRLSVCSVLRCPDLWLQCSVSFVHCLEKTHLAGVATWQDSLKRCSVSRVETESGGTRRRTGGEVRGKEANGVGSQAVFSLTRNSPASLLQSFSADPHSKKASTRLNWHPRRYKWTRPFRWKTECGFCACAITFRFHSTKNLRREIKSD